MVEQLGSCGEEVPKDGPEGGPRCLTGDVPHSRVDAPLGREHTQDTCVSEAWLPNSHTKLIHSYNYGLKGTESKIPQHTHM